MNFIHLYNLLLTSTIDFVYRISEKRNGGVVIKKVAQKPITKRLLEPHHGKINFLIRILLLSCIQALHNNYLNNR